MVTVACLACWPGFRRPKRRFPDFGRAKAPPRFPKFAPSRIAGCRPSRNCWQPAQWALPSSDQQQDIENARTLRQDGSIQREAGKGVPRLPAQRAKRAGVRVSNFGILAILGPAQARGASEIVAPNCFLSNPYVVKQPRLAGLAPLSTQPCLPLMRSGQRKSGYPILICNLCVTRTK